MATFSFKQIEIPGAYEIAAFHAKDNRGYFIKSFEKDIFAEHGINFSCNEDFISCSAKNVIRGMHFQLYRPQAKLVGVIKGEVFDVIVDLRRESPTFGQWRGFRLSEQNCRNLYIPRGCAHGFLSLKENSIVSYKCDGAYDNKTDTGIMYNDLEIGIEWPVTNMSDVIVSERDKTLMTFAEFKRCAFQ